MSAASADSVLAAPCCGNTDDETERAFVESMADPLTVTALAASKRFDTREERADGEAYFRYLVARWSRPGIVRSDDGERGLALRRPLALQHMSWMADALGSTDSSAQLAAAADPQWALQRRALYEGGAGVA